MTTPPIFKDAPQNGQLLKQGYAITPFLKASQLKALMEASEAFIPENVSHFFATTHSPDLGLRKRANEVIQQAINAPSETYFDRAQPLGGAFIAKPPHGKGVLSLHQDWNIVDEREHRSYNIWIPLVDTTVENGAVHVLPGSHSKELTYRGPGIPAGWNGLEEAIYPHMARLEMKAGDALVYDHALWHSSPPNYSEKPRPAIVIGMIVKGAPMHAYFAEGNAIAEYALTASYFFDEPDITRPTTLEKIRTFEYLNPVLSSEKLHQLYLGEEPERPKRWWWQLLQRS